MPDRLRARLLGGLGKRQRYVSDDDMNPLAAFRFPCHTTSYVNLYYPSKPLRPPTVLLYFIRKFVRVLTNHLQSRLYHAYTNYYLHNSSLYGFCLVGNFFGPDDFSIPAKARDKKDAESSKIVTSPYLRTAEAIFGGRKSENIISSFEGIRKDSDIIQQIRLY